MFQFFLFRPEVKKLLSKALLTPGGQKKNYSF